MDVNQRTELARKLAAAIDRLGDRAPADLLAWRGKVETFAATRREASATAAYQDALQAEYEDWLAGAWPELSAAEDEDERDELLALLLLALLARLRRLGESTLPQAVDLGIARAGGKATPAMYALLERALADNARYLSESLLPAIREKVGLAVATGAASLGDAIRGALSSLVGRVRQYGNAVYALAMQVEGEGSQGEPVYWQLDESIAYGAHCEDCKQWGNRSYASYQAMLEETGGLHPGSGALADSGNCRCWLVIGQS